MMKYPENQLAIGRHFYWWLLALLITFKQLEELNLWQVY